MSRDNSASVQLAGDALLHSSIGAFGVQIDSELVWVDVPDCRGEVTMYSFSFADWARICDLVRTVAVEVLQ